MSMGLLDQNQFDNAFPSEREVTPHARQDLCGSGSVRESRKNDWQRFNPKRSAPGLGE
jgi:hypothetical protein